MEIADRLKASPEQIKWRRRYVDWMNYILPTTVEHYGNGLEKAKNLLSDGVGIVVAHTHPSKLDTFRQMVLWGEDEFVQAPTVIPIAFHQYSKIGLFLSNPTGVKLYPIVTEETVKKQKNRGFPEGYGNEKYMKGALESLSQGGVVMLAPSTHRRPYLEEPSVKSISYLLASARREKVKLGVMFVGIEVVGAEDYVRVKGYNFRKSVVAHIGETFTASEIQQEVSALKKSDGKVSVERWAFETQFPDLVTTSYGGKLLIKRQ